MSTIFDNVVGFERDFPGDAHALLRRQLSKIARSEHAVLITGESGTGKSRLAGALHASSSRSAEAFVELSCASIPEKLLESELFGYRKGAFSGAFKDKVGLLEKADGGTLFLDEIGEMPAALQPKLLLFLENQRFYPVGGAEQKSVNVRLIAATNQNLRDAMKAGDFRSDLYHRLNVFEVPMLSLRERKQEIPVLALEFLSQELGGDVAPRFSDKALDALLNYTWPGNIRELRNVMLRLATLVDPSETVRREHLPLRMEDLEEEGESGGYSLSGKTLDVIERDALVVALQENSWNRKRTAEQLGVSEKTVYNLIKRHSVRI